MPGDKDIDPSMPKHDIGRKGTKRKANDPDDPLAAFARIRAARQNPLPAQPARQGPPPTPLEDVSMSDVSARTGARSSHETPDLQNIPGEAPCPVHGEGFEEWFEQEMGFMIMNPETCQNPSLVPSGEPSECLPP